MIGALGECDGNSKLFVIVSVIKNINFSSRQISIKHAKVETFPLRLAPSMASLSRDRF